MIHVETESNTTNRKEPTMKLSILLLAATLFGGCVNTKLEVTEKVSFAEGGASIATSLVPDGYAYIDFSYTSLRPGSQGSRVVQWLALPTDAAVGDIIQWDGTKYVKVATEAVTVITDISYDEATRKFTKTTKAVRVIAP